MHFTVQHALDVPGKGDIPYISVFVTFTDVNTELVKFVFPSSTANGSRVWRALSQGLFEHRFPYTTVNGKCRAAAKCPLAAGKGRDIDRGVAAV